MLIEQNGIKIEANVVGSTLQYTVLEQSQSFTNTLRQLKLVSCGGFSLRTNENPAYLKKLKRFYVRGSNSEKDDKLVKCKLGSRQEAEEAAKWLAECCKKTKKLSQEDLQPKKIRIGDAMVAAGATAHFRMCLLSKKIAKKLCLTGKDLYPEEPTEWEPTKPFVDENVHYSEHAAQACDVMNKTIMSDREYRESGMDSGVMNAFKVTPSDAKKALQILKNAFQEAENGGDGVLTAFWRLVSFIRSDDSKY